MPRYKDEWFTKTRKYLASTVRWTSTSPDENGKFARQVTLTSDLNGRLVSLAMSPAEARAVGIRLMQHACGVEEWNKKQKDGDNYTDQQEWAVERADVGGTPDYPRVKDE
jgi:hypothetical protein